MLRRVWLWLVVLWLAACGIKLTIEHSEKATLETKPREKKKEDTEESP